MLNVVLVEPEIPQNCGNIARTCAATGCRLHLIRPLGFDISEKAVKRAGLDYWNLVEVIDYENLEDFFARNEVTEMWCLSTKAPGAIPRHSITTGPIFSSEKRPRDCRRRSWRRTARAVSASPCARRPEV